MVDLLITYLKKKGKAASSIKSYYYMVERFISWTEENNIEHEFASYAELLDYVKYLRKRQVSQSNIKCHLVAINHYYNALIKAEITENNPARHIEIKTKKALKLYPTLTKEQLENLYINFDTTIKKRGNPSAEFSAIRNKVAIGLMVFQGLNTNVLSKLTTADINVLSGSICIKGGRDYNGRTLALHASQIIEIDRYINQTRKQLQQNFNKQESELLLITGYGNYNDAHRLLIKKLKKQEPQLQSTQQIKTAVITHWLKAYNLREVQHMAGHRYVNSTESYKHNDTEGLQMDIDRFHPMNE
jgi:integrase/recombinase XerD